MYGSYLNQLALPVSNLSLMVRSSTNQMKVGFLLEIYKF